MVFEGFVGGAFNKEPSIDFDAEDSLNLFYEPGSTFTKGRAALLGSPGIAIAYNLSSGPIRGLLAAEQVLWAVSTAHLWKITADGAVDIGSVDFDLLPVDILTNGNGQIGVVSNGRFFIYAGVSIVAAAFPSYTGVVDLDGDQLTWVSGDKFDDSLIGSPITVGIYSTSVLSVEDDEHLTLATDTGATLAAQAYISTPLVSAGSGTYIDGYFVVNIPNSRQFNISNLNDGTTWDKLDFGSKEGYPDPLVRVFADHEDLWLFGSERESEVWNNTGAANFPFQRNPNGVIPYGCGAKDSVVSLGNGVAWLGVNSKEGGPFAILCKGYQPYRVSTPAIENAWAAYAFYADAVSYTYMDRGHEFWCISFPAADATWVYDVTVNLWHRRGFWNGSSSGMQRQWVLAYGPLAGSINPDVAPRYYVGDHLTGSVYTMSPALVTDAGTIIERIRTAPHLSNENFWSVYNRFEVETEVQDVNIALSWSSDGGHTFNTPRIPSATTAVVLRNYWNQLGSSRTRTFRVRSVAAIKQAWFGAFMRVSPSSS